MKTAIISPLVMVALIPIPAFLLGRMLSNNLCGLVTALFAVLSPSFIGVSMAGYCDSDAPVVFYFFFSILVTLLALKNPKPIYILFAVLANLLFIWNWGGGWLTLILFTVFTIILPFFRLFEEFIHSFSFKLELKKIIGEIASLGWPIFVISLITNTISFFIFNGATQFASFLGGIAFTGLGLVVRIAIFIILLIWNGIFMYNSFNSIKRQTSNSSRFYHFLCFIGSIILFYFIFNAFITIPGKPLIVNVSVQELQPINILNLEGFMSVASRTGILPTCLAFGLFGLAIYKIWRKEKILEEEVFFFFWLLVMFILISRGVRFSLQFSVAAAVAGGYVIGNYKKYPNVILSIILFSLIILYGILLKGIIDMIILFLVFLISLIAIYKKEQKLVQILTLGVFSFQLLFFISTSIQVGQAGGMEISNNWYNALDWLVANSDKDTIVATWWDPGHILAGYSYYKDNPFKVMADGAHCGQGLCVIYDHDVRIRDMGRAFSTNNETEALEILKKYTYLSSQQCKKVKEIFGDKIYDNVMKEDPCKNASKMYVIASNDLIGKYYWLSYFGSYDIEKRTGEGKNYDVCTFSQEESKKLGALTFVCRLYKGIVLMEISIIQKNQSLIFLMNSPYSEPPIRNGIIRDQLVYHEGLKYVNRLPEGNYNVDGLVIYETNSPQLIFMEKSVRDSLFTNMFFFNGEGLKEFGIPRLENFKLKYSNPEVKIFEVKF